MSPQLTALIVDDEALARALIVEYLAAHQDIVVIGESCHGLEAVADIEAKNPDLVFLDIQMPKLSGLEVLEATGRRSGVIFTTAYDEFALRAFDLSAVDYLLKPFSQRRFDEALDRARKLLGQATPTIDSLLANPGRALERIVIRDRGHVHVVPVEQVLYVQAEDDYIRIHTETKSYLKTQHLSDLEAQLDSQRFVRVHRSYLINIGKLQGLARTTKDSQAAVLANGAEVPISRAGHERIRAYLGRRT
jgi:two-component system, LytTR family, response regulator